MPKYQSKPKTRQFLGKEFSSRLTEIFEEQLEGEEIVGLPQTTTRDLTVDHLLRYHRGRTLHNTLEREYKILQPFILQWLGAELHRDLNGWTVQRAQQERQQFDAKGLLLDDPHRYTQYVYMNPVNYLYVTPPEGFIYLP